MYGSRVCSAPLRAALRPGNVSETGIYPAKSAMVPPEAMSMAEQSKEFHADLAPGDEPVRAEYERDFISG